MLNAVFKSSLGLSAAYLPYAASKTTADDVCMVDRSGVQRSAQAEDEGAGKDRFAASDVVARSSS